MKKIMALFLSLTLVLTGMLGNYATVKAEGETNTVTLALVGSSIDGVHANMTIEVEKGTTVLDAIDNHYAEIEHFYGNLEGYYIGDNDEWFVSEKPMNEYSDWGTAYNDWYDFEDYVLNENTQLYFILTKKLAILKLHILNLNLVIQSAVTTIQKEL